MTDLVSKNPLVQKIVEKNAKEDLLNLLLSKELPFTDEEYLESLVFVLGNEKLKSKTLDELTKIAESSKANYIRKANANHRVAYYILSEALIKKDVKIVALAIRNQYLPFEFLSKIAERGNIAMLEILLENQIKMIAFPQIMKKMEKNSVANVFIKGKINELREFYLKEDKPQEIPQNEVVEDAKEIMSEDIESDADEDEELEMLSTEDCKESAVSLLQIINKMSTSERIKLALTGTRSHRLILVKDPNKMVSLAVIESPKISIHEVQLLVKNRSISSEIISRISINRDWTKNYDLALDLVKNPKTPVKNAMGFVKRLHIKDLTLVTRDKNISPVVRNLAINYHREKSKVKT